MANQIKEQPKKTRTPILRISGLRRLLGDVTVAVLALAFCSVMLYGSFRPVEMLPVYASVAVAALACSFGLRLYRINSRHLTFNEIPLPIVGAGITAIVAGVVFMLKVSASPIWSAVTLPVFFFIVYGTSWFGSRIILRSVAGATTPGKPHRKPSKRLLIVGAGDAGTLACRELQRLTEKRPQIVGFVDDDETKLDSTIYGIPVLGSIESVPELVESNRVDEVLIAIPSATGSEIRRIFDLCSVLDIQIRTLPSFEELISDKRPILGQARAVRVEDLLRRDPTEDLAPGSLPYLAGQSVFVSGGGGSIGSELVRMVVRHDPSLLVLFGKGENSIFEMIQELKENGHSHSVPVIGDVRDAQAVSSAFERYRPTVVFHAAAHKHVPLMESVPIEAIYNNVLGTLNMAEAAARQGCKKFILVSTDKAVNPTNVMGATKRVAEMIVASMSTRSETDFAAVRFGNVLGSRGSLIPILRKQIERGGPITITHPDMTRYFMTIPEAAQLILQAGSLGSQGDIFILDMGEPVRIMDVATDLVRLSGLEVGKDIELKFIGIRPGEKMYEELSHEIEQVSRCEVPKLMRVSNRGRVEWPWLKSRLDELFGYCRANDPERARALLMDLAWGSAMPPDTVTRPSAVVDPNIS